MALSISDVIVPNHADSRYREAMHRLRFLLHQYDTRGGVSSSDPGGAGGSVRPPAPRIPIAGGMVGVTLLDASVRTRKPVREWLLSPSSPPPPPPPLRPAPRQATPTLHLPPPPPTPPPPIPSPRPSQQKKARMTPAALVEASQGPPEAGEVAGEGLSIAVPLPEGQELQSAEAGTSTADLLVAEGAKVRHLGQLARRQDALVSQLETENSMLRDMMDETEQRLQELVAENRSLAEQIRTRERLSPDQLPSTAPLLTSPAADAAVPGDQELIQPTIADPGRSSSAAQSGQQHQQQHHHHHHLQQQQQNQKQQQQELEECRAELEKLKKQAEEHERWLAGEYIEQQQRQKEEKDEMAAALGKLQSRVSELQKQEETALERVQQSVRLADQARLEKAEAENTADVLRRELASQRERQEQLIAEQEKRVTSAHQEAERSVQASFDRLRAQLTEQTEKVAQLEAEQQRLLRRHQELQASAQRQEQAAEEARQDAARAASRQQQELAEHQRRRANAEAQLAALKAAAERAERESRAEVETALGEITSLRKQLTAAETSLSAAQRDRVKLQEQVNELERRWSAAELERESVDRGRAEDVRSLAVRLQERELELLDALRKTREEADARGAGLEAMVQEQTSLITQLQSECAALAAELASSHTAQRQLGAASAQLERRLAEAEAARRRLEARCYQYGRQHELQLQRGEQLQLQLRRSAAAAAELAAEREEWVREKRQLKDRLAVCGAESG